MKTILLISPYWKEPHRWMISSVKLAELWQRLGYRVVVACMGTQTHTEQLSPSLTVHFRKDFFLRDPWNYGISLGFSGFVLRLVRAEKPDIIVVNKLLFWSTLSLAALRLTGHRVILLTDALVGMTWWPRGGIPKACAFLYAWTIGWLLLLLAQKVVTFHPQPSRLLKRLCIANKTQVIPTGIDPTLYGPAKHDPEHVTITYVGRLESVKGVEDFLTALDSIRPQYPTLHAQVAGWHVESHPLVEAYRDRVAFLGLRDDIPDILARSDIFVLPSYSEGLSNALMEAMASGCACIASEVGGNPFLIQNGVSGFLFPAGDREALASHIRRLLDDSVKRRSLGEAARMRIEKIFSWDVTGREYRALFDAFSSTR